jgi:alpha-methylacyl-CoA racemase
VFEGSDACVTPVLTLEESVRDPQLTARGNFHRLEDAFVPTPAPRLSRSPAAVAEPCLGVGAHTEAVLAGLGLSAEERAELRARGAVG